MWRKLRFGFLLLAVLLSTGTLMAQSGDGGPVVYHTAAAWDVTYWSNPTLSGTPTLTRQEVDLNWDWALGAPVNELPSDGFSARWTRVIDVPAGQYRFVATADDGIRVYVDGQLIIDQWWDHPAQTFTAQISLSNGHHEVMVEYYENSGYAVAKVSWEAVSSGSDQWVGRFFGNPWLSGSPVSTVYSDAIDFNWGYGGPSGLPTDNFSARWTRTIDIASAGTYVFTAVADDGVRVYVDGTRIIDDWSEHPLRRSLASVALSAGNHDVIVEYFEKGGLSQVGLVWAREDNPIQNWRGEYFNNLNLSGAPTLVRDDANINFNWGTGAPTSGITADNFSVRWSKTFNLTPGNYRFTTSTDDGVRLWVNGHQLINQWRDQPVTNNSGVIYVGGQADVVMEYYEHGGLAEARLTWQLDSGDPPPPPPNGSVTVDDRDSGFVRGGQASAWRTESEGYNGRLTWTRNNDYARGNYNYARWYPTLAAGRYEVFAYIPDRFTTTSSARYWVSHRDGLTLRIVDQSVHGGEWVSLGIYSFQGSSSDYVSLADVTYEPYLSTLVGFDAMRWDPR